MATTRKMIQSLHWDRKVRGKMKRYLLKKMNKYKQKMNSSKQKRSRSIHKPQLIIKEVIPKYNNQLNKIKIMKRILKSNN